MGTNKMQNGLNKGFSRLPGALFLLASFFLSHSSYSQCSMCRAAIESEGNTLKAEAVNDGIVYLMIIPYLLVAGIMYYVYATRIRKKDTQSK